MGQLCATSSEKVVERSHIGQRMRGKVAIITGAYGGIGKHIALVLADLGVHVILTGRKIQRLEEAAQEIRAHTSDDVKLTCLTLDVSSLRAIRKFVEEFEALNLPLHLLINNAGIMAGPYQKTEDGFEAQFGTNYIGHFLLTELLLPKLKASAPSRIINVASMAHIYNYFDVNNLNVTEKQYSSWKAYGTSKLENILHARNLAQRLQGTGVTAYSLHPGAVATELGQSNFMAGIFYKGFGWCLKQPTHGASTVIYLAISDEVEAHNGGFFKDCHVANPSKVASDINVAKELYVKTLQILGDRLPKQNNNYGTFQN